MNENKEDPTKPYTPIFSNNIRTIIYVVCMFATAVSIVFMSYGQANIGGTIGMVAALISSGFGVAYNPVRMSNN